VFGVVPPSLLAVSAAAAFSHAEEAEFALGAATLMLLFAGIHNAWDAVTWHLMVRGQRAPADKEESPT